MIINGKYVDYILASLLKEKGFDEEIETLITPENKVYFLDENSVTNLKHIKINNSNTNPYSDDVSCPDLWDVMKWLREEHKLHIEVYPMWAQGDIRNKPMWKWSIKDLKTIKRDFVPVGAERNTLEEAIESGFYCCLEDLI